MFIPNQYEDRRKYLQGKTAENQTIRIIDFIKTDYLFNKNFEILN
jgi:hypothetical protein